MQDRYRQISLNDLCFLPAMTLIGESMTILMATRREPSYLQ
ncbi:MAG: hypothetical protein PUD15_02775 [Prevotella sp.]|nr:hypothetical protein [Prevotella sp.]